MAKKAGKTIDFRKYLIRFWLGFASLFIFVFLLFFAISKGWLGFMPSFEELENPQSNLASEIISADQELLGSYFIENRININFSELSPNLINALVATEDIRFTKHSGIDIRAFARVTYGVITGKNMGGGSTITQQLAKNLFPRQPNRNFIGMVLIKFKEWVVAAKLERNYSKEEIIAMYFNTVDFGSHSFGIKSAARTFYNKEPNQLSVDEAALLVGILKAPTWFSPVRNPHRAMERRNVVLHQMRKYDFISQEDFEEFRELPIDMSDFRVQDHVAGLAPYMREYLRIIMHMREPNPERYSTRDRYVEDSTQWNDNPLFGWMHKNIKPDGTHYNLYKDGLRIYTTINATMQRYAEEAVTEHLSLDIQPAFFRHWRNDRNAPFDFEPGIAREEIGKIMESSKRRSDRYRNLRQTGMPADSIDLSFNTPVPMKVFTWNGEKDTVMTPMDSIRYYKHFIRAGLMSMEPQTGFVRAYVGGINYKHFQYDQVSMGRRQVGSTFKPFVYTLAMQEGDYSPCSRVPNVQQTVELPTGEYWEPRNSSRFKENEMVTLKEALANSINWISAFLIKRYPPQAVITMIRKMGITAPMDPVPAICLGTPDISLYEMVGAMNTFANKGVYIEPMFVTRIEDKHGNVISRFIPRTQEAMSEETAFLMLELMKGVVESGTGVRLRFRYQLTNPIAGKTGTTQSNSDGWFMGITPDLTTGVWAGGEDRSVRFRIMSLGQGANLALPIWALYMKKIYADTTLNISMEGFEPPMHGINVETNCDKFETQQWQQQRPVLYDDF
jgi:penicillin-binding protein 1A